jgi:transposase
MTKTRRTRQQWQQLINEQPDSGLTVHDYCQQQHLNVSGFYLWRKKLAAESENVSATDWLSLPAADLPGHTGDCQIELLLPGGVTLRMNIRLYTATTDMRKQFDGLAALVQSQLGMRAQLGDWFVFINRRRTQIKVLYFHQGGYCLWSKRLEKGTFARTGDEGKKQALNRNDGVKYCILHVSLFKLCLFDSYLVYEIYNA